MSLTPLVLLYVLLIISLSQCTYSVCFDCFGLRRNSRKRMAKVQPSASVESLIDFDNCLRIACDTSHSDVNDSRSPIHQLSDRTSMISIMKSHNYPNILSLRTVGDLPDYQHDSNVNWFNISSYSITTNSTIIKSNLNIFLLQIIAYDISHVLYFLGHYLPLNNTAITSQYQMICDYFAQFQHGFKRVNLKQVMQNFQFMREKVRWSFIESIREKTHTEASDTVSIPQHLFDDLHANVSLSRISKHRQRARATNRTRRIKCDQLLSNKTSFWNTQWRNWGKKTLSFKGLHPAETDNVIEALLWRVTMEMDKMKKIISGHDDSVLGMKSFVNAMKLRKGLEVFTKNFFKEVEYTLHLFSLQALIIQMNLPDGKAKRINGLRQAFLFDMMKFILSSSWTKGSKFISSAKGSKLKARYLAKWTSDKVWIVQIQFNSVFFGNYKAWKIHMMVTNHYLMYLLQDEKTARKVTFSHIHDPNKDGVLFLLNVVLQFAQVGGRCGYVYNAKEKEFKASLVCEVSLSNINAKEDNAIKIDEYFRIPHKLLQKDNDTDNHWILLNNFDGVNFGDLDHDSAGSYDTPKASRVDTNGLLYTSQNSSSARGITENDLKSHDEKMQQQQQHRADIELVSVVDNK